MKYAILLSLIIVSLSMSLSVFSLEVGDVAPCIELNQVYPDGTELVECVNGETERDYYQLIEFMSINCGYCVKNMPLFNEITTKLLGKAKTKMISIDRNLEAVSAFMQQHNDQINYPFAFDNRRLAKKEYSIRYVPTIYLIAPDNKIVFKHVGMLNEDAMNEIESFIF